MKTLKRAKPALPMVLGARTATDLMTPNPVPIRQAATAGEAAAFLSDRGISAARRHRLGADLLATEHVR